VVNADRQAVDEEEDERQPSHRVAVKAPAGGLRRHCVERDVGRDQPEIDDRVQRPGEERPRQSNVDGRIPAERRGNDLEEKLRRDAGAGPQPQHRIRNRREHGERDGSAGIGPLPAAHGDDHQHAPDPGPDHDKHDAEVIEWASRQRRVKGVEHGGEPGEDCRCGHESAYNTQYEAEPGP